MRPYHNELAGVIMLVGMGQEEGAQLQDQGKCGFTVNSERSRA